MEFDLDLAKAQSSENPVYYIQYAHARTAGVLRTAEEQGLRWRPIADRDLSGLVLPEELSVLKTLAAYPDALQEAALAFEPHRLAYFLQELAGQFHAYYYKHRIITDDHGLTTARLALVAAVGVVLRNALSILGVSAPERM
jgi:arginyl-tRNA synthetase